LAALILQSVLIYAQIPGPWAIQRHCIS